MGALEKVGMLKMDLLGLKTLTVIHDAVAMIAARTGEQLPTWSTLLASTTPRCTRCSAGAAPRASSSSSRRWPPTRSAT